MRFMTPFAIGTLVAGLAAQASRQPQKVEVGTQPSYSFRSPLLNGRGVRSLDDLKGAPTIIEFWGVR
jgi:hypothetical protein